MTIPRVAFFTDSFHEVNGVARTSREFEGFAMNRGYPFFSLHPGRHTRQWRDKSLTRFEIRNSALSVGLETELRLDPLFLRHWRQVLSALQEFRPDLIHVTGPGHSGLLGVLLARHLQLPVAASWHTNLHEFGTLRLRKLLRFVPARLLGPLCRASERCSLNILRWFYGMAGVQFAPNPELQAMLSEGNRKPCHLMRRGIDTELFSPLKRTRTSSPELVIGYVGRLSPEKSVRQLVQLERKLIYAGLRNYRFVIVGDGGERPFLEREMRRCHLPGTLLGEALSRAYADMDVFVFPSETDTFGNVVLEALASGVPAIVTAAGGPQYIIENGVSGLVATTTEECASAILHFSRNRTLLHHMSQAARQRAFSFSWDAVFENVYSHYPEALHKMRFALPTAATAFRAAGSGPHRVPGRSGG